MDPMCGPELCAFFNGPDMLTSSLDEGESWRAIDLQSELYIPSNSGFWAACRIDSFLAIYSGILP